MMSLSRIATAALLSAIASTATADPTDYAFDSVSRFDIARTQLSITGVLRNTTTPTTVTFMEFTNGESRYAVNRCMPVLLTMMEKPGRYYLNLNGDPLASFGLISCGLELRS